MRSEEFAMLRAKDLHGRPVVDLEGAEKIGTIDELLLDLDAHRVAGLVAAQGPGLLSGGKYTMIPTASVRSVGPDAVTVQRAGDPGGAAAGLASLPRLSKVVGRKVVSQQGELLGTVSDLLVEDQTWRIVGYQFESPDRPSGLEALFSGKKRGPDYVRAVADLRIGEKLIVVPEEAVVRGESAEGGEPASPPAGAPVE
jgi:uncharacterized protein YrrD